MKKLFVILSLVALSSCGGSTSEESVTTDTTAVDTTVVETVDSVAVVEDTTAAVVDSVK